MVARLVTLGAVAIMAGAAPVSAQTATAAPPDMLLTGGKVFTADSTHPWAEAVAIRADRIIAVGTNAELARLAGPETRRIALGGRVVVPGFNDAHDHVGDAEYGVRFSTSSAPMPDPSAAQVLDSLRAVARRTRAGTWLHSTIGPRLVEDTAIGRAALDRVAPNHPVLLNSWSGHGMILNSAGLRRLGIDETVRDPLGGTFERDSSGRLTGVLQEYAEWSVLRRLYSSLPTATLGAALRAYAAEAVRTGVTTVQDMNGYLDPKATLRAFGAASLPIRFRIIPYPIPDSALPLGAEWRGVATNPAPRVVVSGVKWILDGTPLERGALERAPYADRPGWYGQLEFPADTIRSMLVRALATREPLHLHVVGDSTAKIVLGMMESLAVDSVWRPLRVRFEHGDGVTGELVPIASRLGIVIVQNPTHFALGAEFLRARFGTWPPGFMGVRSLLAAGVHVAIGSDGPRNPFLNIMFAITHPDDSTQALTREQAVTAYTLGSAYAEFAEKEKGTLAPGMLADLAVLSQDIFTAPPQALPGTSSVLTIVGGRVVYDRLTKR